MLSLLRKFAHTVAIRIKKYWGQLFTSDQLSLPESLRNVLVKERKLSDLGRRGRG